MSEDDVHEQPLAKQRHFATTQWSVVLAAGDSAGQESREALTQLCLAYWYPLYVYIRRRVYSAHTAQDLTQAFFTHLLEQQTIGKADRTRGRFRAFLLTALKNFLANERAQAKAIKRGGGRLALSLDFEAGESRYHTEPVDTLTPEMLYERRWILTVLDQVLERLRDEMRAAGKIEQFEHLKQMLTGEATAEEYRRSGEALGISPVAAKQAAYRLRKRYRELFRAEVARTVADDAEVRDEIGKLLKNLGG